MPSRSTGVAAIALLAGAPAQAKVEGDTIILGSAISLTGKYSTNGIHAQNGYELAVKQINEMGGVKVGGKSYKLKVVYYDDESTPARGATARRAPDQAGRRPIYAWPVQLRPDQGDRAGHREI